MVCEERVGTADRGTGHTAGRHVTELQLQTMMMRQIRQCVAGPAQAETREKDRQTRTQGRRRPKTPLNTQNMWS